MKEQPLISIVANFYKSGRFIDKLMKSVLAQTYPNWEFIAVNDCSPGNDLAILKKWEKRAGGRMRIIDNPHNLGVSRAKRRGIEAAQGKYITFADGDDWFMPDALESMCRPMEEHGLDMVIADCYRIYPPSWLKSRNRLYLGHKAEYGKVLSHDEFIDRHFLHYFGIHTLGSCAYWGHMYRTTLARDIHLPADMPNEVFEDGLFNMYAAMRSRDMMFVRTPVYCWRWGGMSSGSRRRVNADYMSRGVLEQYAFLYRLRMDVIRQMNFDRAVRPLQIELKNVMVIALREVAVHACDDPRSSAAKKLIEWCYTVPEFDAIASVNPPHEVFRWFPALYVGRDTEELYRRLHQLYRSEAKTRMKKKILSLLT